MTEGLVLVAIIAVVAGLAGLVLGMLLARPLTRLAERASEEDEDGRD